MKNIASASTRNNDDGNDSGSDGEEVQGGGGLYRFDPVNARQDSQFFDSDLVGGGLSKYKCNVDQTDDDDKINNTIDTEEKQKTPPPNKNNKKNNEKKEKSMQDEEETSVIIRSMAMLQKQKRRARKKKHVRRELGKEERHKLHTKELELFMKAEESIFHHVYQPPWKKKIRKFFENSAVEIIMVLLTIVALYGSDVADAYLTAQSDIFLDISIWLVMLIFLAENILLGMAKRGYLCSKAFNLELTAALSMLFDIKSLGIMESIENVFEGGTAARAGRAARAGTRAGRLTKLLRLLRLMRIVSLFVQLMRWQNTNSKVHRLSDVELFGSEHEKEIIAKGLQNNRPKKTDKYNNEIINDDAPEPEDEAGAMSRALSQTITIDAIIFIICLLFASALVNFESSTGVHPEFSGLKHLNTLALSSGRTSLNVSIAAEEYQSSFRNSYLESSWPNMQECLYLEVLGVIHVNRPIVLGHLRAFGERNVHNVSSLTSAIFDGRALFKDLAFKSFLTTTVIIFIIFAMIISFKNTSDRVTKEVNTPLLNLCDDMLLVSDMDLEGPILHMPSKFNEIRNAQLAFLKMKHALSSFGKYVPHEVVRQMIAKGEDAQLGVERKTITIFFSDIAGFTTICEKMRPNELLILLSEYFDAMQTLIGAKDSNGTLLEFIGDALLVIWNAPQDVQHHESKCVEQSIKMHEYLHDAEPGWNKRGYPSVKIRIGIHTAKVFVGNLGSPVRMKYGVLGDGVNLASRLEELNKRYNSKILISDATQQDLQVQKLFTLRQLDQVAVKGKAEGTKIYECLGRNVDTTEEEHILCRKMKQAFHLYYERKFTEAQIAFDSVQRLYQEIHGVKDAGAMLLSERCGRYADDPPGENWNGTEVLNQKHF